MSVAKLNGAQIKELALKEIAKHPEGIGPSGLLKIIQPRHPETADGTIRGAVWKLKSTGEWSGVTSGGIVFVDLPGVDLVGADPTLGCWIPAPTKF